MHTRRIGMIFLRLLLVVSRSCFTSGSDVAKCARCFTQKWNWASWKCDVHCDIETSKYGQVDAFSASPVSPANSSFFPIPRNQPIVWGNVHINIQGGYNISTGIFTVTVPGVYHITLIGYSHSNTVEMEIVLEREDATSRIGYTVAKSGYTSSSCSVIYELQAGDKIYAIGTFTGRTLFVKENQETRSVFNAHLLYKSLV